MTSITKLRTQDSLLLLRAMAKLVASQQPLERGLLELADQWRGPLAQVAAEAARKLSGGASLPNAFSEGDDQRSRMLAATIEAGLQSSQLDAALESWATLQLSHQRASRSLIVAMIYPVLLLLVVAASLLFTLRHLTPHYQRAFDSVLGRQPNWMHFVVWFSEHLLLTSLLILVIPSSLTVWWIPRSLSSRRLPSLELANRWYLHAHIARLAESLVARSIPVDATFESLYRAAGRQPATSLTNHSPATGSDGKHPTNHNDSQAHVWLGRETVLALVAWRDRVLPVDQVQQLLGAIATQSQRMADIRAARNAQWLPMMAATAAGVAVVAMYVGLIYGPWLSLLRAIAQ